MGLGPRPGVGFERNGDRRSQPGGRVPPPPSLLPHPPPLASERQQVTVELHQQCRPYYAPLHKDCPLHPPTILPCEHPPPLFRWRLLLHQQCRPCHDHLHKDCQLHLSTIPPGKLFLPKLSSPSEANSTAVAFGASSTHTVNPWKPIFLADSGKEIERHEIDDSEETHVIGCAVCQYQTSRCLPNTNAGVPRL